MLTFAFMHYPYPVCILFGMPSLHLFTFLMFFLSLVQGSEGVVAFASMLKKNQCLKTLDLSDDSVGVEGAFELIESLKHKCNTGET